MFLTLSLKYVNIYDFILLNFLFFGSMSGSNCYYLTCMQISQEAGQMVWYSHLFQNSPQLIVTHTVKGFGIVNIVQETGIKTIPVEKKCKKAKWLSGEAL